MKAALGLVVALVAVGAGAYLMLGGRMPSMPHLSGSRRRSSLRGHAEQSELKLFIDNDGNLYRQQTQLSEKLWMYLVENGAKKYAKEFGGVWHKMFSMADRKAVARALAESFVEEYVS